MAEFWPRISQTGKTAKVAQQGGKKGWDWNKAPQKRSFCSSCLLIHKWPDKHPTKWCGLWIVTITKPHNKMRQYDWFGWTSCWWKVTTLCFLVGIKSPDSFFQVDHKLLVLCDHTESQKASLAFRKQHGYHNAEWKHRPISSLGQDSYDLSVETSYRICQQ